ncbi:MAG: O-antigen/teichoic acid export membrane protein [Maribacter sp.]|jgi:O-antigen/teichoic acid export membrane protein
MSVKFNKYLSIKSILSFSGLNYLQAGFSFLVTFVLARELGRLHYGYIAHGLVFANTVAVFIQFGFEKTLVRELVQLPNTKRTLIAASAIKFFLGLFTILSLFIWLNFVSSFDDLQIIIITLFILSGFIWGMSPKAWFDYKGKIHLNAVIALLDRLLYGGISLFLIFNIESIDAIVGVAIVYLCSRLFSSFLEWRYVAKSSPFSFNDLLDDIKGLIKENSWVWLAAIGNLMMTQLNQLMLEDKIGTGELAVYSFAFQIVMLVRLIQRQILRLSTPSIADAIINDSKSEIQKKIFKYCLLVVVITAVVGIPVYIGAPYFIEHFVGEDFLPSIPVLRVLLIWIALFGVAVIINQFLLSYRLNKVFFITTVTFGLLSIVLANIFIDKYQAVGAALSLLIAHLGSILVQSFFVFQKIRKHEKVT